jgi:hypothetical protein
MLATSASPPMQAIATERYSTGAQVVLTIILNNSIFVA